jgi:hypothetical protein
MTPSQLKKFLTQTIRNRLPILVTGAPGVGKSDIVAAAAAAAGCEIILSHPVVADPTDAKGLPWRQEGRDEATFLPFGDLARAIRATSPTVWFLDDLGQAAPAVQASYMQLLLARRVNEHALSEHITFVAATNRRTDRAGVVGLLEPVKSRFASIVELQSSIEDWAAWAIENAVPPALIAFLRFRPELLHQFQPTADLCNSPCPRTWAHVGRLTQLDLPPELEFQAIAGAVGAPAATEYLAFLRVFKTIPSLDGILENPDGAQIPSELSTLYAVAVGLACKASPSRFAAIARYAERLVAAGHGEFAVLLIRDSLRRDQRCEATKEFNSLIASPVGDLFAGIE